MKTSKITVLAVAGTLGVATLGAVVVGPALASGPSTTVTDDRRVPGDGTRITELLSDLVEDGTLTQEQADAVGARLAQAGPGSHGGRDGVGRPDGIGRGLGHLIGQGLDAAATALGLSETEVRDALREGRTLADLAEQEGVDSQAVVDAVVAEAEQELTDAVDADRLTQQQADEIAASLPERIGDLVENGGGRGWRAGVS